jgi:hypothetical protein
MAEGFRKKFMIMPINMAMTAEPITWMGRRLSSQQARAAMARDKPMPGRIRNAFFNVYILSAGAKAPDSDSTCIIRENTIK